uniref:Toll-like receptor 7 n=1 Tax=Petromyzon marinus TaxID=7757 RepID=S4RNV1_PETMA
VSLKELDLSGNCWRMYHQNLPSTHCNHKFTIEEDAFVDLLNLTSLSLNINSLILIPKKLPSSLKSLWLEFNHITTLSSGDFSGLHTLQNLHLCCNCYLSNACYKSFNISQDVFTLPNLTFIDLSNNNLTDVKLNLSTTIRNLVIGNNDIRKLEDYFHGMMHLESLDVALNCPRCITASFPCKQCPNNEPLDIDTFIFSDMPLLTHIDLASTSLKKIPPQLFENNTHMTYLDLSYNYLGGEIENGIFLNYLQRIEHLNLSFNYYFEKYPVELKLSSNFANLTYLKGLIFQYLHINNLNPLKTLLNLTSINVSLNFIKQVNIMAFKGLSQLNEIIISENLISPENNPGCIIPKPNVFVNNVENNESSVLLLISKHDKKVGVPQCKMYNKVLDLGNNSIFFIQKNYFHDMENIECLVLSRNFINQALNGTEFSNLPKLKYLDLSYNRISLVFNTAFSELPYLEVLDLSYNQYYFSLDGLVHSINFISGMSALTELRLVGNGIRSLSTDSPLYSNTLKTLNFQGNRLDILWEDGKHLNLFENFTQLQNLDISHNKIRFLLKNSVFVHLKKLKVLNISHNRLTRIPWDELAKLEHLQQLDLSYNHLTQLSDVSNSTSITKLIMHNNNIAFISADFVKSMRRLTVLDIRRNNLTAESQERFSIHNMKHLEGLQLSGNPFLCTCSNVWCLSWINSTTVIIPKLATNVKCKYPLDTFSGKNIGVIFSLNESQCEYITTGMVLFLIYNVLIISLMVTSFIWVRYRWNFAHLFRSLCRGKVNYTYENLNQNAYDAFVAYDSSNVDVCEWVLKEFRVHLEEKSDYPSCCHLCIEDRDWLPGISISNNLATSVYNSRKTVFLLTKDYITSGHFRQAWSMAQQRMIDEKKDVMVFVMLERMPSRFLYSRYMRMRKRLCPDSFLQWPPNPHAQHLFWKCLRAEITKSQTEQYWQVYEITV